jgi:hypothetical protein
MPPLHGIPQDALLAGCPLAASQPDVPKGKTDLVSGMNSRNRFINGPATFIYILLLALSSNSLAQTNNTSTNTTLATITVEASDPQAAEAGPDTGTFIIHRQGGNSNAALTVYFHLGGTARNHGDYRATSSNFVSIAAGTTSADVIVTPIADNLVEGSETVALQIHPPPMGTAINYRVGSPSNAVVFITDNSTAPPTVQIVSPTNNSVFEAPADIDIFASPSDSDGTVETVEFFAGNTSLGIVTNNPFAMGPANPWHILWAKVPAGRYVLRAKATDDKGAIGWSDPVQITVGSPPTGRVVVNVFATDTEAEEIPVVPPGMGMPQRVNYAVFTIVRTDGGTNSANTDEPLTVYFRLSGTASNGVDYTRVESSATIPAGSSTTDIIIDPIDDSLVEGTESVVLKLESPACIAIFPPPPGCYELGHSTSAVAYIRDNDSHTNTNPSPKVVITQPTNGASFTAPAKIYIEAVTTDSNGYAPFVEFFANQHKIGEASITFIQAPPPGEPITLSMEWTNATPGSYYLTARATDDQGAIGWSAPVRISVVGTNNTPLGTNLPIVTIIASDSFASEGGTHDTNRWTTNSTTTNTGTNAWPNLASFVIRRSGPTNAELSVSYAISGTASNGVDYATLSGNVSIPAGYRAARIVVTPIDDKEAEQPESVVLSLQYPPTPIAGFVAPPYLIGDPGKAAAVIADNDALRPPTRCLSDGLFHACFTATNGTCYRLEYSSDLLNWTSVCTNTVTEGVIHFIDSDNTRDVSHRFYRAVPEPCPPPDSP